MNETNEIDEFILKTAKVAGFTIIEIVVVLVIVGVLAAIAVPRYIDFKTNSRVSAVTALAGTVKQSMYLVYQQAIITNNRGNSYSATSVSYGGILIRIWNNWPDRWWDGIGISLQGASPTAFGPSYLSTAPYPFQIFTFYGYGNAVLPGGLCGWVVTDAPNPSNCSITYGVDGSGRTPPVVLTTTGC